MQAVMSIEEVASVVPSTITWREPVEIGQVRGPDSGTNRAAVESPRGLESPAHGGHLSDGDTPASAKVASRTRFYSGSSPGYGYGGLRSSSSSPNLAIRDPDQVNSFTETTQIIGIQARLQEKPFSGTGVPDSVMMPLVTEAGVSPGSPQVSRQTIRSRARPRRLDEPAPFLSVDNLPVDKVIVEGKPHSKTRLSSDSRKPTSSSKKRSDPLLNGTGRKTRSPPQSAYTPPMPRSPSRAQSRGTPSATQYNYNSFFTHKSSAFLAGPPNLWSMGNKYWPQHGTPNDRQKLAPLPQSLAAETLAPRSNTQVSQPFKHDVDAEVPVDRPVSPSQDLKERTIYALREVTRVLNRQQSPPQSRRGGRLLKGRLKPLHTFKLSGPAIDNCKGIQPEEGDHGPSDSRMLQRKQELLSMLPPDIFQPRPMTGESVHRTSIVSQLSTDRDKDLENDMSKTEGGTEDQVSKLSHVLSGARMPPNSLASLSDGNVSYLQDALTSHIDIPESTDNRDAAGKPQDENSKAPEDRSRVHQISEAYATSYEGGSKIDLSSQQVEAAGDAPTIKEKVAEEKTEDEKEGSVKDEVKATMSDYMNEGGAARVLSEMVQRVTNSAKKSTVEEDTIVEQKYDAYFADSETRSDTPTSRTGSSTLMRRRSSMDDMEMDQASCELTDMVSEDGLGEDGSVKQFGKESNVERGSLSSLSKAKGANEETKTANNDTECQSRDVVTPTNVNFQKDPASKMNLSEGSSTDKSSQDNLTKDEDVTASTLYRYIDSGLVESDFKVEKQQELTSAEDSTSGPGPKSYQKGDCDDDIDRSGTESVNDNDRKRNVEQKPAETEVVVSSDDAESDMKALPMGSDIQGQGNNDAGKAAERHEEPIENAFSTPVSKEELATAIPEAGVDIVATVQIEVTGPESESTSEGVPDLFFEEDTDTKQSTDLVANENEQASDEIKMATIVNVAAESKKVINTDECNGERTDLPEEEIETLSKEDDGNEEAQEGESSSCHSNGFRKDDRDHDDTQGGQGGGSHSNSDGSASGNGDGSNIGGRGGNKNSQNDPPSGTGSSGTQQRPLETTSTATCNSVEVNVQIDAHSQLNGVRAKLDDIDSEDCDDDIPDIDEAVLFCGICGLDEDTCLCPHSTFNEKLESRGHRPTIKSASAAEDKKSPCLDAPKRSFSAVEGLQGSGRHERPFGSWNQEAEIEQDSIQRHLVLEYQAMIEKPRQKGFLSSELTSPRFGQGGFMLLQGTGLKRKSRPSSAKRRPQGFSSEFEFRDHRTDHSENRLMTCNGIGDGTDQLECSMTSGDLMSDSGCWSDMQGGVTSQSEESFQENVTLSTGKDSRDPDKVEMIALHQSSLEAETLEVVAKPLSKPSHPKISSFPAATVPAPLCFRINAKPPPGFLYYFAYGADMNKTRMTSYIGREADHRLWGILFGFQLTFNKRGADLEAGGFPNIAFSPDSSVEGCVYLITPSELQKLDQHIGCPKFYTKAMFPVWMMNCAEPNELGVAQYCIPALMYVAQDEWTLNQEEKQLIESDYSVGQCLKGSDLLTPSYIQHISTLRVH